MKNQFEQRFEEALQKTIKSVQGKGGVKKADKVHQRIGNVKERYPSVLRFDTIEVFVDAKQMVTNIN